MAVAHEGEAIDDGEPRLGTIPLGDGDGDGPVATTSGRSGVVEALRADA